MQTFKFARAIPEAEIPQSMVAPMNTNAVSLLGEWHPVQTLTPRYAAVNAVSTRLRGAPLPQHRQGIRIAPVSFRVSTDILGVSSSMFAGIQLYYLGNNTKVRGAWCPAIR